MVQNSKKLNILIHPTHDLGPICAKQSSLDSTYEEACSRIVLEEYKVPKLILACCTHAKMEFSSANVDRLSISAFRSIKNTYNFKLVHFRLSSLFLYILLNYISYTKINLSINDVINVPLIINDVITTSSLGRPCTR